MESLESGPSKDKVKIGSKKREEEVAERIERLKGMTKAQKLRELDDLLLDSYIGAMEEGNLKPLELGAVVTYLKNNKEVAEKKEHSEADLIDELVEE